VGHQQAWGKRHFVLIHITNQNGAVLVKGRKPSFQAKQRRFACFFKFFFFSPKRHFSNYTLHVQKIRNYTLPKRRTFKIFI
jgi:hypothetical protein